MNKIFLTGNLTKKPELRYTQNGSAFSKMSIAVNRTFSKTQATDFFDLTAWDKLAEFCDRYLDKGSRILVEGQLRNTNYTDKNGVKHYSCDIAVENIEFAGSKSKGSSSTEKTAESPEEPEDFNDLPF